MSHPEDIIAEMAKALCRQVNIDDGYADDTILQGSIDKGMWRNHLAQARACWAVVSKHQGWRPIAEAKLGEMVWLWAPLWRHAFPGQRNGDYGEVYVDTCEPDAKGWQTHATHFASMLVPPPSSAEEEG